MCVSGREGEAPDAAFHRLYARPTHSSLPGGGFELGKHGLIAPPHTHSYSCLCVFARFSLVSTPTPSPTQGIQSAWPRCVLGNERAWRLGRSRT